MKPKETELPEGVVTVSEYVESLNKELRNFSARILGEVTRVTLATSGHAYFSLKDKSDGSMLRCVMWRGRYVMSGIDLVEGMEIIASGVPEVYAPRGDLQLMVETVELFGEGALKKAYVALKNKLEDEGLFSLERKRALPEFPRVLGVVTSRDGAVIHDFLNNLGKHGFHVKLFHSLVEGQQSAPDLVACLKRARKEEMDVLVLIRGGGSLESLQGFNNEMLVREIAKFPVPVIAGIGHDKDVPLASLVADVMVSTPTAATVELNRPWRELSLTMEQFERSTVDRFAQFFHDIQLTFERRFLGLPERFSSVLIGIQRKISLIEQSITLNDPRRQLRLGYSIARSGKKVVKSYRGVRPDERIEIQVADGIIDSTVSQAHPL